MQISRFLAPTTYLKVKKTLDCHVESTSRNEKKNNRRHKAPKKITVAATEAIYKKKDNSLCNIAEQ